MSSLTIVTYHYVRQIKQSAYPFVKGLELEGFQRQLDHLASQYNIITAEQLIAFARKDEKLPERSCLLSFDDGYKDHIDYVLPELMKRKIQGSFFLPVKPITERAMLDVNCIHFILASQVDPVMLISEIKDACFLNGMTGKDFALLWNTYGVAGRYDPKEIVFIKRMLQHALPERLRSDLTSHLFFRHVCSDPHDFANELYLSLDDAKTMVESAMYVGGHGYSHLWLNKETKHSQEMEISQSLKFLKQIGAPTENWIMCYPYGAYNADTLGILKLQKCSAGLTTRVGIAQLDADNLLELPRLNTNDFPQ